MPSSSGISMSSVTRSGSRVWIFLSASSPLRAVPTTRNSPEPSTISDTSLRMNALSSTTSTVGSLEDDMSRLERLYGQAAVAHVEVHATAVVATDLLGDERNPRVLERRPGRYDVPFADLEPTRRQQRCKHARATDDLCPHAPRPRA